MATNFNKPQNVHFGSNEAKAQKKSRNWLVIILIIVFVILCIGLIFNTVMYFKSDQKSANSVQVIENTNGAGNTISDTTVGGAVDKITNLGEKTKDIITSSKSPKAIFISLLGMFCTGGSLYLLLFLKLFDKRNYYNVSNSFTFISNNRFFYISLFMGIVFAFYIGGVSLFKNINMDMDMIFSRSTLIQKIYSVLAVILLIENFFKTGYSVSTTLARSGIFLTIGITLLVVGYILGTILFYIIITWLVLKVLFGMIAAQEQREREHAQMDRWANAVADAFARRFGLD